jgi:hypothetical protein
MPTLLPTRWPDDRGRRAGIFAGLRRSGARVCGIMVLASGLSTSLPAQNAPIFRRPPSPPASRPSNSQQGPQGQGSRNQNPNAGAGPRNNPHLTEWMSRHRDLPLDQQQRALQSEPGFRELPAQTQQKYLERLGQLNSMRPDQRARMLEHNEEMERLTGPQRQQVRGALLQLGTLPEDRRRVVARTFRDLRAMPDGQRQQYLNSPAYRSQFTDQERNTMSNLMSVEPYIPGRPQQ